MMNCLENYWTLSLLLVFLDISVLYIVTVWLLSKKFRNDRTGRQVGYSLGHGHDFSPRDQNDEVCKFIRRTIEENKLEIADKKISNYYPGLTFSWVHFRKVETEDMPHLIRFMEFANVRYIGERIQITQITYDEDDEFVEKFFEILESTPKSYIADWSDPCSLCMGKRMSIEYCSQGFKDLCEKYADRYPVAALMARLPTEPRTYRLQEFNMD